MNWYTTSRRSVRGQRELFGGPNDGDHTSETTTMLEVRIIRVTGSTLEGREVEVAREMYEWDGRVYAYRGGVPPSQLVPW